MILSYPNCESLIIKLMSKEFPFLHINSIKCCVTYEQHKCGINGKALA